MTYRNAPQFELWGIFKQFERESRPFFKMRRGANVEDAGSLLRDRRFNDALFAVSSGWSGFSVTGMLDLP